MPGDDLTLITVLVAGLLTFFAPCTFVSLPTFLSYITSTATRNDNLDKAGSEYRKAVFRSALSYVVGFIIVFTILGMTATKLGMSLFTSREVFADVGAAIMIVFGLFMLFGNRIKALRFVFEERKVHIDLGKVGNTNFIPLLLGITSAFSWTPCIGPILGGILFLAGSRADTIWQGGFYLFVYALGISIPFLIIALSIGFFEKWIRKIARYTKYIYMGSAIIMIIIGISLLTGWSAELFSFLYGLFEGLGYEAR